MGDKLNTAEYDSKGRCVRHPAIRLRKKKLFGGWKIIIGHCPECCLDEMRRVRDEIGAEQDNDNGSRDGDRHRDRGGERENRQHRKEKKKKRSDRNRDRERRKHRTSNDSISEVGSEGHARLVEGRHHAGSQQQQQGHPPQQSSSLAPHRDGESEATGSTAQNSSMDGSGSVVSEQYIPRHQHLNHGGRDAYYQQPHPHHQQQRPLPHHQHQSSPPPPQRTMVLSMAFTHPQTGQRGTYTGQVNSINHKPDGKGTVYYPNGSIAEGSWMNGLLMESEDDNSNQGSSHDERGRVQGGGYHNNNEPPEPNHSRSASQSATQYRDPPQGQSSRAPRSSSSCASGRSAPSPNAFSGNLDRLDQLGGKSRRAVPRGASASVQSYNSRGSNHGGLGHAMSNAPSGSASVQDYGGGGDRYHSATQSMSGGRASDGGGGGVFNGEFRRSDSGYQREQQRAQSFHGRAPPPPGYR
mmetsp:Transcript_2022/g.4365  ORF Transcript_2022/g.4365 Transcript_2022/m.4365 type:complete len:466 (+) Transcript_2022:55-1452(+)|eukprot:CAMPEP_0172327406 /NCGR_PEP_ID=MMETSP1058-20130122/59474_1 /TAXON_ID=83371 /ORGANISM="Detonula confervacea, Strain CCMP 353" /LENGTH=465 /DNA_ID=CAMNT_0013044443 /DNA_START=18 /DNA_END=1415 /DNA_ORIENTATION=-